MRSSDLVRHDYSAPNVQPCVIAQPYSVYGPRYGHEDLYVFRRRHLFVIAAYAFEIDGLITDADSAPSCIEIC